MSVEITLTRGQVAIVDDVDQDLDDLKWCAHRIGEKFRAVRMGENKQLEIMARVVYERSRDCNLISSEQVGHYDKDPLNNRRENLYLITSLKPPVKFSKRPKAKGYIWDCNTGVYRSQIMVDGRSYLSGYFDTPEEAHDTYIRWKQIFIRVQALESSN